RKTPPLKIAREFRACRNQPAETAGLAGRATWFPDRAPGCDKSWPELRKARRDARRARHRCDRSCPPRSLGGHATDAIAHAHHAAALDPAASEIRRPALRPVVATAGRVDARRAAELGQVADQRVFE